MTGASKWLAGVAVAVLAGGVSAGPVPKDAPPDPLARGAIGIQVQTGGLVITTVYAHMPAGKAGIQVGDKLVRVGTLRPQAFEQVVAHICSYRPGAVVEFEVERGSEKKVMMVTIAARPGDFDRPSIPNNPFPNPDD